MARATLDPASPDVAVTASPNSGYRFKYRAASGAATTQTQTASSISANFPAAWVRLTRVGNLFTSYYSVNGSTWTVLGSVTLTALPATTPIYVGLAVASNSATATTTADFQNWTGA
jgi:regulation of enolase protein 1 (concanavalin A-like superfamily)